MANEKCACGEKHEGSCEACHAEDIFTYWCDSCKRSVADKRCPYCGLKAKKKSA